MNRAEAAVQSLYEDSRLREDLIDDEADVLLKWAEQKLIELDAAAVDDATWEQALATFKGLVRGVNQFIGQRAYAEPDAQDKTFASIQAQAAALNLPVPAQQFSAQTADEDNLAALKALLHEMDAVPPRMTRAGDPAPPAASTRAGVESGEPSSSGTRFGFFGIKPTPETPAEPPSPPEPDAPKSFGERLKLFGDKPAPQTPAEPPSPPEPDAPKSFGERFKPFGGADKPNPSTTSGRSGLESDEDTPGSGAGE